MVDPNRIQYKSFLKELDKNPYRILYHKIYLLDEDGDIVRTLTGNITQGSVQIQGNSSVRRTASLTFVTDKKFSDIEYLFSFNKRIKIMVGMKNTVTGYEDLGDIIWFTLGVFLISQFSVSHSIQSTQISLTLKDKMCFLNGEHGGNIASSIRFDSEYVSKYDKNKQIIYEQKPVRLYDIIYTIVETWGKESNNNIFVEDVDLEIKQKVYFLGDENNKKLYYSVEDNSYSLNGGDLEFKEFENCGYIYTDFISPQEITSNISDNVCSILDNVKNLLTNYEYYYDKYGIFHFKQIDNFVYNKWDVNNVYGDDAYLLNDLNKYKNFQNTGISYEFNEKNCLVSQFGNSFDNSNIKNDFHLWGKTENNSESMIHYHLVIKKKPNKSNYTTRDVVYIKDENGKYTGQIRLFQPDDNEENIVKYKPSDWRAELYLSGLEKKARDERPDIYEQEILDLFDNMYDMRKRKIKKNPTYWIDYIYNTDLQDISVDNIGTRIYSFQENNIKRIFEESVPDVVMIRSDDTKQNKTYIKQQCKKNKYKYTTVSSKIMNLISESAYGYSADSIMSQILYQYTDTINTINITCVPIYYLEPNSLISVKDSKSGIDGTYQIQSISLPLGTSGTMNITASKVEKMI